MATTESCSVSVKLQTSQGFDIGKTVLQSLTGEINGTNKRRWKNICSLVHLSLCLASELLAGSEGFTQKGRASRFDDKIA